MQRQAVIEPLGPACVVRSLAEARIALGPGRVVTLLSARGAAMFAGVLFWQALVRAARPYGTFADVLDCADAPGRALEALRLGQRLLILEASSVGFDDVVERAGLIGARVLPARPHAFDCGARDAARRVTAWLDAAGQEGGHHDRAGASV